MPAPSISTSFPTVSSMAEAAAAKATRQVNTVRRFDNLIGMLVEWVFRWVMLGRSPFGRTRNLARPIPFGGPMVEGSLRFR